jgi:hypothetical protein
MTTKKLLNWLRSAYLVDFSYIDLFKRTLLLSVLPLPDLGIRMD